MSTQSIYNLDLYNILDDIDKFYIKLGDSYLDYYDYGVWGKPDIYNFRIINILETMLSSNIDCEIGEDKILEKINLILIKN